jgi:sugar phosphate isomerase/epimerase
MADPFRLALNTSTISGAKPTLLKSIHIAAEAGYGGIEPWIREIDDHTNGGGSLADIRKAAAENGLVVENAIGFFEWAVDDDGRRAKGLDEARRNMDMVAAIGGKLLAAPPFGAHADGHLDLVRTAVRYAELLDIGRAHGVTPVLEFWGASRNLYTLGQAALVLIESGRTDGCLLADTFHIYRGGGDASALRHLNGTSIGLFHVNDYPADPPRASINDADRVYPGDGIAPLGGIFRALRDIGYRGALSLELFNRTYWQHDARTIARTGLEKLRRTLAAMS